LEEQEISNLLLITYLDVFMFMFMFSFVCLQADEVVPMIDTAII